MVCTAGVADGDVNDDGRPLLWKQELDISSVADTEGTVCLVCHHQAGIGTDSRCRVIVGQTTLF